jgi:hypothetical protein
MRAPLKFTCPSGCGTFPWKEWVKHVDSKVCAYGNAKVIPVPLKTSAAARTIYILTQDGKIQRATYSRRMADQWLAFGEAYDYTPLTPESDVPDEGTPPESTKEQPSKAMERTLQITKEMDELRKKLEQKNRRFQPKSDLLRD